MSTNWFSRKGIWVTPIHPIGWILVLVAAACAIYSFIDIDSHSHSASDTLMNFAFRLVGIYVAYSLVAYPLSKPTTKD